MERFIFAVFQLQSSLLHIPNERKEVGVGVEDFFLGVGVSMDVQIPLV